MSTKHLVLEMCRFIKLELHTEPLCYAFAHALDLKIALAPV